MTLQSLNIIQWKTVAGLVIVAALCWTFGTTSTSAQQWQYVYGGDNTSEEGMRGVIPVTRSCRAYPYCASCTTQTDGYIAVGSTYQQASTGDDVYVVRTDNNGAAIWEVSYDISGNGSTDQGRSIVELSDGSGFAITGFTTTSLNTDVFIMKIDCDGAVVWTRTYRGPVVTPDNATGAQGYDIIEATTGNSTYGTRAGDLLVAGAVATTEYEDALLLRVTSTGTLIWDAIYDETGSSREIFWALIEATNVSPEPTGDIIAAGQWGWANSRQGYVVRVNGNTGAIGAGLQGAATYGNPSTNFADFFFSLVELQNPNQTGTNGQPNVVLAGHGNAINGGAETFLVKLDDGDPCVPLAQRLVGDGSSTTPRVDLAYDIKEIPFTITGTSNLARWDLVITGITSMVSVTNDDAFLLGIDPTTLAPIAGTGQVYHPTTSNVSDRGTSLYPVDAIGGRTQGVIMCGTTRSDWLSAGDPQDIFLVKTNSALSTGLSCESSYSPSSVTVSGVDCEDPSYEDVLTANTVTSSATSRDWGDPVCTGGPIKAVPDFGMDANEATLAQAAYSVQVAGNPLHSGDNLRILFEGNSLPESVGITVTNSRGQQISQIASLALQASGVLSISTANWPSGVCFVTINDREYRRMLRVVVLE